MVDHFKFTPPTTEQMRDHLAQHGHPKPRSWTASLPLILLIVACVMTLFTDHVLTAILPWIIVVSVVYYMGQRMRYLKGLQTQVTEIQDFTLLRHPQSALRLAWPLLEKTAMLPQMQSQLIACMAYNLDRLGAYDEASLTYHFLIDQLPLEHPGRYPLQLQQAQVWLLNDELASADTAIRQLRSGLETLADASLDAAYYFVKLLQQVRTHHFAEAIEKAPTLLDHLRPLGIDAGYGYGLMALCFFKTAQQDQPQRITDAVTWWERATHLLGPAVLSQRFTELIDLDDQLSPPLPPGAAPGVPPEAPRETCSLASFPPTDDHMDMKPESEFGSGPRELPGKLPGGDGA